MSDLVALDVQPRTTTGTRAAKKTRAARGTAKKTGKRKSPLPPKFRDEAGNHWSGHGKRPNWYKAALAAGKTPEDMLVR